MLMGAEKEFQTSKKKNPKKISGWQMSPFSSTLHNNFKERLSVFHMINDQQGVESERGCKIFSAGFPPPPTFAAVSMFHMIKSHMIKT